VEEAAAGAEELFGSAAGSAAGLASKCAAWAESLRRVDYIQGWGVCGGWVAGVVFYRLVFVNLSCVIFVFLLFFKTASRGYFEKKKRKKKKEGDILMKRQSFRLRWIKTNYFVWEGAPLTRAGPADEPVKMWKCEKVKMWKCEKERKQWEG
jgi:hypothetical protein